MVLQAARFYGAALEADPTLGNPDLEHFILWIDDEEKLWGDFKRRRPQLGELPWMRDPQMAMNLTNRITLHTTPIHLPSLAPVAGEELKNDLYLQEAQKGMQPTPPPAVTIPMDRVDPNYRRFDSEMGALTDSGNAASLDAPSVPGAPPVPRQPSIPEPKPVVAATLGAPTIPRTAAAPEAKPAVAATLGAPAIPRPPAIPVAKPVVSATVGAPTVPRVLAVPTAPLEPDMAGVPQKPPVPGAPPVPAPSALPDDPPRKELAKPNFLFVDKKPPVKLP